MSLVFGILMLLVSAGINPMVVCLWSVVNERIKADQTRSEADWLGGMDWPGSLQCRGTGGGCYGPVAAPTLG